MRARIALMILFVSSWSPGWGVVAAEATEAAGGTPLEEVRRDLADLRFERALNRIEAFLGNPGLGESRRVEGLVLRAQAHVSYGDLDAAESDYREILALRPAYVPDSSLTPPKAMARFEKVRAETVGTLDLSVDPPEAEVRVDGRTVTPSAGGSIAVLAGERVVRAEHPGFDPAQARVRVEAGDRASVELDLVPNARDVVIVTEPAGVRVLMDGRVVGDTRAPDKGGPAELVLDDVPLGVHSFELRKDCYRTRRFQDLLTVDLEERSDKRYGPLRLERARGRLHVRGRPPEAEVRVEGEIAGSLPVESVPLCPGTRTVEVRHGGRTVWWSTVEIASDTEVSLDVAPRPNAVVMGAKRWPSGLASLAEQVSTRSRGPLPAGFDPGRPESWNDLELPPDTDLVLAVVPSSAEAAPERWFVYAPGLDSVARMDASDLPFPRAWWTETTTGVHLVDSRVGGPARVAWVDPESPASAAGFVPGDRILTVGGEVVEGAASFRAGLADPGTGALRLDVFRLPGRTIELTLTPRRDSPRLHSPEERSGANGLVLFARASVDAVTAPEPRSSTAWANLALLLGDAGRHFASLEAWRRVRWPERPGLSAGTVDYYSAVQLLALGRDTAAIEAFRRAAASRASAFSDEGPPVALAAADHLADLGVSAAPREP